MTRKKNITLCIALLSLFSLASVSTAQEDNRHEAYGEIDLWVRTAPDEQIFLYTPYVKSLDDDYREAGLGLMYSWSYDQNTLAMFDWLVSRENLESFRNFTARVGLYYGQSLGDAGMAYKEIDALGEVHVRWLAWAGVLFIDRNRFELRSISDDLSWRYRNRLTMEKQLRLFDQFRFTPYVTAEISFDSRFATFNRSRFTGGAKFPVVPALMVDLYYAFSNDTRSSIQNKHGVGITFNLYVEPKDIFN